jgi:hypothetical protein
LLYFVPADPESAFYDPIVVDMEAFYSTVEVVDGRWVFALVLTKSLVVPLLDSRGEPPVVVVE